MGFFSDAKDRMVETMAVGMLNSSVLKPYGRIRQLRINSTDKTIQLEMDLIGERDPVQIDIQDYELQQNNGKIFLIVKGIDTSRQWLTALARNVAVGRPFELPGEAASLAGKVL